MEVLYTAEATATGGRKNGHAWSSDGAIDVQINPPKEVGGSGETMMASLSRSAARSCHASSGGSRSQPADVSQALVHAIEQPNSP